MFSRPPRFRSLAALQTSPAQKISAPRVAAESLGTGIRWGANYYEKESLSSRVEPSIIGIKKTLDSEKSLV